MTAATRAFANADTPDNGVADESRIDLFALLATWIELDFPDGTAPGTPHVADRDGGAQ
jgi:hypothetical protein